MNTASSQFVGWTALIGGAMSVVSFVALILLFVVGEPFGTLNDLLTIPTALLMAPLIVALYRVNAADRPALSLLALVVGLAGFVAAAVGGGLLVLGRLRAITAAGHRRLRANRTVGAVEFGAGAGERPPAVRSGLAGAGSGPDAHVDPRDDASGRPRSGGSGQHGQRDGRISGRPARVCTPGARLHQLRRAADVVHPHGPFVLVRSPGRDRVGRSELTYERQP